MFAKTSRYYGIDTATLNRADGTTIRYVKRRLLPAAADFALLAEHRVVQGDRLDNVTAAYLKDPELFWRVADANDVMRAEDLTAEVRFGVFIRIPGPQQSFK